MCTTINHPVPDRGLSRHLKVFDIWALWRSALSVRGSALSVRVPGCQKITNDGLTLSGSTCGNSGC